MCHKHEHNTHTHVTIPNPFFFPFPFHYQNFISLHSENFRTTNDMSIQNPLEACKVLVLRPTDVFAPFIRALLVISAVASFSLFFYLTFSDQNHRCLGCYGSLRHSNHRKVQAFDAGEQPTNMSHLVFGIGGSVKTWNERRHYCELWWKKNVTRGFVWLEEKPEFPWPESSPPYRISEDTSKFNYTCWYCRITTESKNFN